MFSEKTYKVIFSILMGLLLLPLTLRICHIPAIRPLDGYVAPVEKVPFTTGNILNGNVQKYLDESASASFGGRSFFVRYYNQLLYSCFHKITNHNIIVGKNGEMFLRQYTDDVSGITLREKFGTVDSARKVAKCNVEHTLELIDSLKAHNVAFLIALAPSKTSVYPELLPDSIKPDNFSLQREYATLFKKYGIPTIDFQPIFLKWKNETSFPLYTKYGTHWCHATIPSVADTLLQCIGNVISMDMPRIVLTDSNITRRYKKSDKELEATCNLMFPLRHQPMPMPKYALADIPQPYHKPRILVVGDSYFTQLENSPFTDAFENVDYWKYNETSYSKIPERQGPVAYINQYAAITDADIVLVMFTTMFSYEYLFGFVENSLKAFEAGDTYDNAEYIEEKIQFIIQRIKSDPEWLRKVEKQAAERHISIEENLRLNAEYVYEMENNKK